jgi:TonB family protein
MKNKTIIFTNQGCLSQDAIEAWIAGNLSKEDRVKVEDHANSCELCHAALHGAGYIKDPGDYRHSVDKLKESWSAKKLTEDRTVQRRVILIASVAAVFLIFFTIVTLFRFQKSVRYQVLSEITEQGYDIDEVLSDLSMKTPVSRPVFSDRNREDSARKEYVESGESQESIIPLAQLQETVVLPDEYRYNYKDIVTSKPKNKANTSRQLRSPFRVMTHPPAKSHFSLPDEASSGEDIFVVVEDMPKFQGGDLLDFRNYILSRIKYPPEALLKNISGTVYVQFVINKNGKLINAKSIKSVSPLLEQEVLRVVNDSPIWIPGKQRGQPVEVSLIVPVEFVLKP